MAVLLPSRSTVLTELEKEFRRRGVPFIVTKGIGFWQRQEVRDVINLAACLADTGDELALFAVLRSPLVQLSDTEILFLSQLGLGSLMRGLHHVVELGQAFQPDGSVPQAGKPDVQLAATAKPEDEAYFPERLHGLPRAIWVGLSALWQQFLDQARQRVRKTAARLGSRPSGSWRRRVDRMAHADLLQRCLEESGAYAIYAADGEGDLMLANLSRLFDLIRREEGRFAPGLARLARWLRDQMNDSLKEEQATLAPEGDAVQIMTVHAAKGLEFPVVAVMKMERQVARRSSARLLVKNRHEPLLHRHAAHLPEPSPGTVAVKVRHPRRPRELYTSCLLRALQQLDLAQQLAESRRLFYVAATRAKERLILAGRPSNRPGQSWQKWFGDALGITEEHLAQNVWQDTHQGHMVQIITDASAGGQIDQTKRLPPDTRFALDYLHERPKSPMIATTSLEPMREGWQANAWEWWLKYRVQLDPHVKSPRMLIRSGEAENGGHLGTVIGTLVHRLFEMPGALQSQTPDAFRQLLEAMAASLLLSPSPLDGSQEEENPIQANPEMVRHVADAVEQIWRRLYGEDRALANAALLAGHKPSPPTARSRGRSGGAVSPEARTVAGHRALRQAAGGQRRFRNRRLEDG
jgi:ATP-dependent exoDNAse (exonuclease V) beta subunit